MQEPRYEGAPLIWPLSVDENSGGLSVGTMRAITESELRQAFGDRTFARGLDYFTRGYVEPGVKKGNKLYGAVLGSAPEPYRVCVDLAREIQSTCSCPVRVMCKHGAALTLHWLNERSAFCDADELLASLARREKSELLRIIGRLIEQEPALATTVTRAETAQEPRVNLEAITRKVHQIMRGHQTYYALSGKVTELEQVKKTGDALAAEGRLPEAVAVYLLLVEQGIDAFEARGLLSGGLYLPAGDHDGEAGPGRAENGA